jgi:hypothetical protein
MKETNDKTSLAVMANTLIYSNFTSLTAKFGNVMVEYEI